MDISHIRKTLKNNGLKDREGQIQMIEQCYNALKQKNILCVEAPTGTGKTLSYLIAAHEAREENIKIIIATATIALQEQLIQKDIPLFSELFDVPVKTALAKGRRRYLCHARLHHQDLQTDMIADDSVAQKLQHALETTRWRGDRDTLQFPIEERDWLRYTTDSAGCMSKLCEFYEDCTFFKAKKKMHSSEIVVTNHSLLLSELELGSGTLLPELDKAIIIIDECHHLPEKALDHFAKSSSIMAAVDWINSLNKTLNKGVQQLIFTSTQQTNTTDTAHQLVTQLKQLQDFLLLNEEQFQESLWRLTRFDQPWQDLIHPILTNSQALYHQCDFLYAQLEQRARQSSDAGEIGKLLANMGYVHSRAKNFLELWTLFCQAQKPKEAPIARWFSKVKEHFWVHAAPINVSQKLQSSLWQLTKSGTILCSATIRALDSFNDYLRKVGLTDNPQAKTTTIAPCFNYAKSIVYVPRMQFDPVETHFEQHCKQSAEFLTQLAPSHSGTLMIFTSKKAMHYTYECLTTEFADDVLMQGDHNKSTLITRHKKRVDQGQRSILFGLTSFGEGLDLPGQYCEHVFIHKLPFAVPTTPVELTRNEWLKAHNRDPFMLATLPATSVRLAQYAGRLLRSENDVGTITIFDRRLYTKTYGKKLLANLNHFTQIVNQELELS